MRRIGIVALVALALLATAAVAVAGNGKAVPGWNANSDKYTAETVTNPFDATQVSDTLVRERTPEAVLAQHLDALNSCDWVGLMQQYPDSYELRLPGGTLAVNWVATAPFLAEPYRGADAYITDDGLMVSMVSTFDGTQLKFKP